jgi:DNA-binding XRE family transcriptional regulator
VIGPKGSCHLIRAATFSEPDAEDFLGLTDDERRLVEPRLAVSRTVRRLREQQGMTQQQLAAKLKSSQSRVAKVEAAAAEVSLDLSIRALFAAGGSLTPFRFSFPFSKSPMKPFFVPCLNH